MPRPFVGMEDKTASLLLPLRGVCNDLGAATAGIIRLALPTSCLLVTIADGVS